MERATLAKRAEIREFEKKPLALLLKGQEWILKKPQERELALMPSMLEKIAGFCSEIRLSVPEGSKNAHVHVADLILSLPPNFDKKKLALLIEYQTRAKMLNLDRVCRLVMKQKPGFVFKEFELRRTSKGDEDKSSAFAFGLNLMMANSSSIILKNTYIDLRKFNVVNK